MGLIGITGKIGAGKDLIGGIIQYLLWHKVVEEGGGSMHLSIKDFVDSEGYRVSRTVSGWEVKKFAGKLKEIVCILTGCRIHDLEDREFKEKELGEEWWYYIIPGINHDELLTLEEYNNLHEKQKGWCQLIKPTPRLLLQLLGTECGRKIIHPNVWVNALMVDYRNKYECIRGQNNMLVLQGIKTEEECLPNWIITDVRFPNEVKAIKERNGIVIRKLGKPITLTGDLVTDIIKTTKNHGVEVHQSEIALDNTKVDYEIPYCEEVQDLVRIVERILIKEKIL